MDMPTLNKEIQLYKQFKDWLTTHRGGSKIFFQADQISSYETPKILFPRH